MRNQESLKRLIDRYGELVGGPDLARELGMRTADALRSAIRRGRLPIRAFQITGRRGWYVRTCDLAMFLVQETDQALSSEREKETPTPGKQNGQG